MELVLSNNSFQELTKDEMYVIGGGMSLEAAMDIAAVAISIVGIAITPAALVAAVGAGGLIAAAAGGVIGIVSLIRYLYDL